jgi:hypothetical protein
MKRSLQFERDAAGAALVLLANYGNGIRPEPIPLPVSQEMLAEMIGTTRSRGNFS